MPKSSFGNRWLSVCALGISLAIAHGSAAFAQAAEPASESPSSGVPKAESKPRAERSDRNRRQGVVVRLVSDKSKPGANSNEKGEDSKTGPKAGVAAPDSDVSGLDELLPVVLENNPDILLAKAKLREAEAELNRVQAQATRELMTLHQTVSQQRTDVAELQDEVARLEAAYAAGTPNARDFHAKQKELRMAIAALASSKAQLDFFCGRQQKGFGALKPGAARTSKPANEQFLNWRAAIDVFHDTKTLQRFLTDLQKELDVKFDQTPLTEVVSQLQQGSGIDFLISDKDTSYLKVTLTLRKCKLGAILQAIEDQYPQVPTVRFIARDYGFLITRSEILSPNLRDVPRLQEILQLIPYLSQMDEKPAK